MIERLEEDNSDYLESSLLTKCALGFCILTALYFSSGVLKGFGEIENQNMARVQGVPPVEQSYVGYMCLGAKSLAEKVYSTLK